MLTLAGVEEILGTTLPVPSRLPALWGTVLSSDWQVKPTKKAARLQLVLGGRASNRPGLITIDYEAAEPPDVEATSVDPWHLVFYASAEGVTLLCTLNQRRPMAEAAAFMDGFDAEEVRLLSHETLAEAKLLSPATTGRDAPEGRGWREDTGVWFDESGSRIPEVTIDSEMAQLHRLPDEI